MAEQAEQSERPAAAQPARPAWRNARAALSVLLSLLFIGLAGWYLAKHPEEIDRLKQARLGYLAAVAALFALNTSLRGYFTLIVLRTFDVRLTFRECIWLAFATTMSNMLLPMRAGAGMRAVYLNRFHNFPYTTFVSTMAALFVFFAFVQAAIGLVGLGWIYATRGTFSLTITAIVAAMFVATGWLIVAAPKISDGSGRIRRVLHRISAGWTAICSNRKILAAAMVTVLLSSMSGIMGFYCAFKAFYLDLTIVDSAIILSSQNIGNQIGITPGGLGFQEALGLYFAKLLPVTTAQALTALATVRVVKTAVAAIGGVPGTIILTNNLARAEALRQSNG